MPDGGIVAGHRLTGRTRTGELGTWHEAASPAGATVGLLRFDPGLAGDPEARRRLVAEVLTDRRLVQAGTAGLLPITDLVTARGEVWLIAGAPGMPSVADLLAAETADGPDAGSVATVLMETAQALLSVHAAGVAHGSLHPGTVVLAPDGTALLAERGLAAALHGQAPAAERDVAAWSSLALGLAARWAADRPAAAELFHDVSRVATTHGLAAARDRLLAHRDRLPTGFGTRDRLVEAIRRWTASQAPMPALAAHHAAEPPAGGDGDAVTLLRFDRPVPQATAPGGGTARTVPEAAPAGRPGGAGATGSTGGTAGAGSADADDVVLRFGPGVPTETTAAQIWRTGRDRLETLPAHERLAAVRRRRRGQGRRAAFSAIVLALMAAGIVLSWLLIPRGGTALTVTKVDVRGPKTLGCDKTATIIGVITTNGEGGTVRYQWRQSDGHVNKEQTQTVRSGETTTRVPLRWSVSGPGRQRFTATLRVLSPVPDGKPIEDAATFSYRC